MRPFPELLLWLDRHPGWHHALAWSCFGLLVLAALRPILTEDKPSEQAPAGRLPRDRPLVFAVLIFATLAAFRWPGWFDTQIGNPDEAQMIAGAITLSRYPVFWGSVDGTTHGPLCDYVLLLPWLLGAPVGFVSSRIVALLLEGIALVGLWRALRLHVPESLARAAVLPGVAFWSFVTFFDFTEYSSELAVIALAAASAWAATGALAAEPGPMRSIGFLGAGILAGMIPFAKLQGGPLMLAILVVTWAGIGGGRMPRRRRWHEAGLLGAGAAGFSLLVLAFVSIHGLRGGFWQTYVLNNLSYAETRHRSVGAMLGDVFLLRLGDPAFSAFLVGCLGTVFLCLLPALWAGARSRRLLLVGWILFGGGVLAVVAPGRQYTHYLHLLVVPACLLAAAHAGACRDFIAGTPGAGRFRRLVPVFALVAVAVLPQAGRAAIVGNELLGRLQLHLDTLVSPAARRILGEAGHDDRMAMWGWMPRLHVETGLPQATREAHTHWQIEPGLLQDYYRRRYIRDFTRSRPRWFVDAVGGDNFAYKDRRAQGHEIFPELAALIAADYTLVDDIGGYRIYRRIGGR